LHPLKNILNRIIWDRKLNPDNFKITYIHRGGVDDTSSVNGKSLKWVGNSWFMIKIENEDTSIPLHRILTVENVKTGEILWRKRGGRS
jgi:uncharacterized protein (UPF0248 family)